MITQEKNLGGLLPKPVISLVRPEGGKVRKKERRSEKRPARKVRECTKERKKESVRMNEQKIDRVKETKKEKQQKHACFNNVGEKDYNKNKKETSSSSRQGSSHAKA